MFRKIASHTLIPILIIVLANLLVGLFVYADYAESWDEHLRYRIAELSLAAYRDPSKVPNDNRGPAAYLMLAKLGSDAIRIVFPGLRVIESWHWMHFLSFQLGVIFFYRLCLRYTQRLGAIGATLVFNTQPLLWGHAWINPKDIPMMAFFLGGISLGLDMADALTGFTANWGEPEAGNTGRADMIRAVDTDRRNLSPGRRIMLLTAGVLPLAWQGTLLLIRQPALRSISHLVGRAYRGEMGGPLGVFFDRLAQNAASIPVEAYIQKSAVLYLRWATVSIGLCWLVFFLVMVRSFPQVSRNLWRSRLKPFLNEIGKSLIQPRILAAGVLLGLCSSIRLVGWFSGVLVAGFCLLRGGRRYLPALVAYFILALIAAYLTWPAMWSSPISAFLNSFHEVTDFGWDGKTTFEGIDYPAGALPLSYLPVLLTIQFSETGLLLILIGSVMAVSRFFRSWTDQVELALMAAWFAIPFGAVLLLKPIIYDNFRHFLFAIPPLFVFAAIGLEGILKRLPRGLGVILILCLLAPNMYWLARLHPYQYVYYNSLVGGTGGAFRRYEMDYWATSYKEATEYLNATASPGARVVVWGADHLARSYARQDLEIIDYQNMNDIGPADFAIVSTRHNKDETVLVPAEVLLRVGRAGAVFAVVKNLHAAQ